MDTKPYRLQSPEDIAKDYGGNKQKIAQAMQMGVVDPTAGVLAGMFIDRMRAAQMQEQAPQATVAQQVMGGAPAQAPLAQAGGLGATAPASPPMAPQGGAPMAPPPMEAAPPMQAPPQGMAAGGVFEAPYMAGGGLSELPLPDTMFDEDRNGGYAGGGIVAFADGGMSNLYDDVEYWESGGDQSAVSPKGARGVMQLMPGTMRDPGFGVPSLAELMQKGMSEEEANRETGRKYLDAMYRRYGDQATALAAYNWGPGNVDKWLKSGADPKKLPTETRKYISNVMKGDEPPIRERDTSTAAGRMSSLDDIMDVVNRRFAPSAEEQEATDALRARAKELGSKEYYEKERKDSMWETLATIGFNMASSKSPYLLQAVGEAAAAALPGARADKKERKALKDKALNLMVELGAKDRRDAMDKFKMASDVWQAGISAEQFEQKMALSKEELNLATRKLNAELKALAEKGEDVNDRVTRYLLDFAPGTPEHEAAKRVFDAKRPPAITGLTAQQIVAEGRKGAGGFSEGQTAKDTQGRTIVFQGGQWVYP